jgi:hypothetical protein
MSFFDKEELILPLPYNKWICNAAWLSFGAGMFACYQGQTHLAISPLSAWVTSLLYWSHPVRGWRRNLDIYVVRCALAWQVYYAWWNPNGLLYYALTVFGIFLYAIGCYIHAPNMYKYSTLLHCALHFVANTANVILYIEPKLD